MGKTVQWFIGLSSIVGSVYADECDMTPIFYESCLPVGVDLSIGLDDFRGIYSGSWQNSYGALVALNVSVPFTCSFSGQLGGSYGVYEWAGRGSTPFKNSKSVQQQGFITVAATWQTICCSGLNAGLAYDWMLNKNFGMFAVNPFFDQIRGQIGYLFCGSDELGFWGTYGICKSHKKSQNIPLKFKGISQVNLFWTHYFDSNAYTMVWIGTPYQRGLHYGSGRAGRLIFGVQFAAPIACSWSIEGHGSYMFARHDAGVIPSRNYGANLYFALTYSFGKTRIAKNPYMTIGSNSNFMADTNQNF